ncbi:hypothetical protein DPMN_169066 [Dreissena polymorpha]|uniref:Uncharacterized protein n=1 Tax=Dreissena polymorpha TaxID=45954 RepID=A0A9D4F4J8_DREPO|nr:hypothetical protein DPMN_169066 [Dreissena polymorpha]
MTHLHLVTIPYTFILIETDDRFSAYGTLYQITFEGGVAAALPGSDACIAPVSAGVVTVYRGSAGFHRVQPFRLDVHAHSEARHLLHWEMAVCSNCM